MTATTSCDGLYYVEIPEGGYAKVQFGRMNPNRNDNSDLHNDHGGPMYNMSNIQDIPTDDKITLSIGNQWNNSENTWISTTCTEGCIVAGSGDLLLSSKPIVNKQNKVATVSAYLARNAGCKNIFYVNSKTGEGVADILEYLREPGDVLPWEMQES